MHRSRAGGYAALAALWFTIGGCTSATPAGSGSAAPGEPTSSASVSIEPSAAAATRYQTTSFAVPITFETPAGWTVEAESGALVDFGAGAILSIADTSVIDENGQPQPWPADLAGWMASEPAFGAPEVAATHVGGRDATVFNVDVDYTPGTGERTRRIISGGGLNWNFVDNPERWRIVVVPTGEGQGLVLLVIGSAEEFAAGAPLLDEVAASIAFGTDEVFTSQAFDIPLRLILTDDWLLEGDYAGDIDLQRGAQDAGINSIASTTVAGLGGSGERLPWPDDLHQWLTDRPEFEPGPPQDVVIGGRPGIQIDADVTVPDGTSIQMVCNARGNCWLVDQNDRWRFIEVRTSAVAGILVITPAFPDDFTEWTAALGQLLSTLQFR